MAFQMANLVAQRGVGISPPPPLPTKHHAMAVVFSLIGAPNLHPCAGARRLIPLSSPRVRLYLRAQFAAIIMSLDLQATLRDAER
jgi:hypothetical protein